jgi:hypothetical protein
MAEKDSKESQEVETEKLFNETLRRMHKKPPQPQKKQKQGDKGKEK